MSRLLTAAWMSVCGLTTCLALGAPAQAPSLEELKNLTYSGLKVPAGTITLKNGRWEDAAAKQGVTFVGNLRAVGDITRDAAEDAAVLLSTTAGAGGEFVDLAVVSRVNGQLRNVATAPVGPNVKPRAIRIERRAVVIDVLQVAASDAMCCPSEVATRTFAMSGTTLHEQPVTNTRKLTTDAMAGPEWVLRSFGAGSEAPALPKITLKYESGSFTGTSACNRYNIPVTAGTQPGSISIGLGIVSNMACIPEAQKLEDKYLKLLRGVKSFTFAAGQLVLSYESDGKTDYLRFDPGA